MMKTPERSYTIWFTQRCGSSLLCRALADTGVAGLPGEILMIEQDGGVLSTFGVPDSRQLQSLLWKKSSTPNGVCGLKHGLHEPHFSWLISELRTILQMGSASTRTAVWESLFPNHRHIFLTRRNKVRLAVSWWKAITTGEWHRRKDQEPPNADLDGKYCFPAIDRLFNECVFREAAIQELFAEGNITPLTVTYEDLVTDFATQVQGVLDFLEVATDCDLPQPAEERMADDVSEAWVQQFRHDKQKAWDKKVW